MAVSATFVTYRYLLEQALRLYQEALGIDPGDHSASFDPWHSDGLTKCLEGPQ
jgi:hypothetical protein